MLLFKEGSIVSSVYISTNYLIHSLSTNSSVVFKQCDAFSHFKATHILELL